MPLEQPTYRLTHGNIPLNGDTASFYDMDGVLGGDNIPEGLYRLRYDGGTMNYNTGKYQVNFAQLLDSSSSSSSDYPPDPASTHLGFMLFIPAYIEETGSSSSSRVYADVVCPGGYNEYASEAACEIAVLNTNADTGENELSDYIDFPHPGGPIHIALDLIDYTGVIAGPTSGVPKFSLTKLVENKLTVVATGLPTDPVGYDYWSDGILKTFKGTDRNILFHVHRSSPQINVANYLTFDIDIDNTSGDANNTFEVYYGSTSILGPVTPGAVPYSGTTTPVNGDGEYDYIVINVDGGPTLLGTLNNSYDITVDYNAGYPSVDTNDPIAGTGGDPNNTSPAISPLEVPLTWTDGPLQSSQLEVILGWDIWLKYKTEVAWHPMQVIGETVNEIPIYNLADLDPDTEYDWRVVPFSSSANHPSVVAPTPEDWEFKTTAGRTDGYTRDTRVTDSNTEFNVKVAWSLFPIALGVLNDPPSSPVNGDRWEVGIGTGDWVGHNGQHAIWNESETKWDFEELDLSVYDEVERFGIYYRLDAREETLENWILIEQIEFDPLASSSSAITAFYEEIYELQTDLPDWATRCTALGVDPRDEANDLFIGQSDNILEFRILAFKTGFFRNETCGIFFPHTAGRLIEHFSTKTQMYINLDGDYVGRFDNIPTGTRFDKFHKYLEAEHVWTGRNTTQTELQNSPAGGIAKANGLWNPSRITVDNNRRYITRSPSIWTAFRNSGHKANASGVVKYDFYNGNIDQWWQEGAVSPHECLHNPDDDTEGASRGITLDYVTGDAFCSGQVYVNDPILGGVLQRHDHDGGDAINYNTSGKIQSNYGSTQDKYGNVWMVSREDYIGSGERQYLSSVSSDYTGIGNQGIGRNWYIGDLTGGAISNIYNITTDQWGGIWITSYGNIGYLRIIRIVPDEDGDIQLSNVEVYEFGGTTGYNRQLTGLVCDVADSNGNFNVWVCELSGRKVHKVRFIKNSGVNTVTYRDSKYFQTWTIPDIPSGWRPHGAALDADNNIWIAPISGLGASSAVIKIYQKTDGVDWGNGMGTQGGRTLYPSDYDHVVYDQWDTGEYITPGYTIISTQGANEATIIYGTPIIVTDSVVNPPWKLVAYDQLVGERIFPSFSTSLPLLGNTNCRGIVVDQDPYGTTLIPDMYIYSDFTGQVMKLYSTQDPIFEQRLDYEPVWKRPS